MYCAYFPRISRHGNQDQGRQKQQGRAEQSPGNGNLLRHKSHKRAAEDLSKGIHLAVGGKDGGPHFLLNVLIHPRRQNRLFQASHKPGEQKHRHHKPETFSKRKQG